jgi:mannose-6-phosphate isomerase-like protein (cupin superfamily)
MNVVLEGGCRVSTMNDGAPQTRGTLTIWSQVGHASGAIDISMRIIECAPGVSPGFRNSECDDVLFFLGDFTRKAVGTSCSVFLDGVQYELESDSGVYLRPGQTITFDNPGSRPVFFVSCQCPESPATDEWVDGMTTPAAGVASPGAAPVVRLTDRRSFPTADRWYRVLVDDEMGSEQVTQFVGSIPPGRAPDHFHEYEEVLFILRGSGRMWAGNTNTPISSGSCIYLPRRQLHCVENTGEGELRLLGVFYPAGSPSVRYEAE